MLQVVANARRRLWLQTALNRVVPACAVLALIAAPTVGATRLGLWPQHLDLPALFVLVAAGLVALVAIAWQRRPWLATARQLDDLAHGQDRLATALWLAAQDRDDPWVDVQAAAAVRLAQDLDLTKILPWRAPLSLRWAWLPVVALAVVVAAPTPWLTTWTGGQTGPASGVAAGLPQGPRGFRSAADLMGEDAAKLLQADVRLLDEILPQVRDEATRQWLTQVRDVVQGVRDGKLDKRQALERLAELEAMKPHVAQLADMLNESKKEAAPPLAPEAKAEAQRQQDQAVRDAVLEAAKEAAKALPEGEDKQALDKAVAEKDLDALAKLAEKLGAKDMSDQELEKWVKALEKFAKSLGDRKVPEQFKQLAERIDRLQQKRASEGGLSRPDQERLSQSKHELEQLKREHGDPEAAGRRVERLERGAKAAADELRRQQQQASGSKSPGGKQGEGGPQSPAQKALKEQMKQAMRGASDELRRESQDQQARQAQRMGEARMRDLKEALERAGQQGDQQQRQAGEPGRDKPSREQQARDKQGKSRLGKGQKGEKDDEDGAEQDSADSENEPQANEGDPSEPKSGRAGKQPGKGGGKKKPFKLGRGNLGDKSRWEEMREEATEAGTSMKGKGGQEGDGGKGEGDGPGRKGDDAKATKANGAGRSEHLQGQQGSGPDTKKTFSDAAQKGFAHRGWRQVFVEYSEVAEEMLDKEHLPAGRRALVRRYFEQIRPR